MNNDFSTAPVIQALIGEATAGLDVIDLVSCVGSYPCCASKVLPMCMTIGKDRSIKHSVGSCPILESNICHEEYVINALSVATCAGAQPVTLVMFRRQANQPVHKQQPLPLLVPTLSPRPLEILFHPMPRWLVGSPADNGANHRQ